MCRGACVHPPSRPYEQTVRKKPRTQILQTKEAWQSRAKRAGMGRASAKQNASSTSTFRRPWNRQFASMRAVQVYGYGQIWCRCAASLCICHGSMSNSVGRKSFSSRSLLAATYWVRSERVQVAGAACSATLLQRVHTCTRSLGKATRYRALPTACCGRCMGRDGLCRIFGGIYAPPLGALSEARYIYSSLIGKPRRFEASRASGSALWAVCYVPHTSLFTSRIAFWTTIEYRTHMGELATRPA